MNDQQDAIGLQEHLAERVDKIEARLTALETPGWSGKAIAAFVCAVCPFSMGISQIVGFFLARSARAETQHGKQRGEALRMWAYVLGWIAIGYLTLVIVVVVIVAATS